jgi:hypothetical protein
MKQRDILKDGLIESRKMMEPYDHINFLEGIDGKEIKDMKKKNNTQGFKKKKDK